MNFRFRPQLETLEGKYAPSGTVSDPTTTTTDPVTASGPMPTDPTNTPEPAVPPPPPPPPPV